jgi:ketosteroid isomerase-like protein
MSRWQPTGRAGVIVRWEIEPLHRSRRGFDERLVLAAPWLLGLGLSVSARARGGSLLRRALIVHAVRVGLAQATRGDYDALRLVVSPDVEVQVLPDAPDARPVGFEPLYRGRDGYERVLEMWRSDFDDMRYEVREVFDPGGYRLGGRVDRVGCGARSGIEVRATDFCVWEFEGGPLRRQWVLDSQAAMLVVLERGVAGPAGGGTAALG